MMFHSALRRAIVLITVLWSCGTLTAQTPTRAALPVPDIPGYRTLKGDFHLHTVFSDGSVWPNVHVIEAWRDGLDVIALTEHTEYHPHKGDVVVDGLRSYAIARPLAEQMGLILIRGAEITKPDPYTAPLTLPDGSAHFNALFVTDANALNVPDLYEALRRAKAQNAFVFWDHPRYRVPKAEWFPRIAKAHEEGLFRGMELVNGPDVYWEAFPWIAGRSLTILANSDAHMPTPPRETGHRRAITLLFVRTVDEDGVRDALEQRRTAAWLGDDVFGEDAHLMQLWQGAVTLETPELVHRPGRSGPLRFRNTSAIGMTIRPTGPPEWLVLPETIRLDPERVSMFTPGFKNTAPLGRHLLELELEIVNLHIGPDRRLVVRLPVVVEIQH